MMISGPRGGSTRRRRGWELCLRATTPIAHGSSSNSRSLVVKHPVGSAGVLSSRAPLKPPDETTEGGAERATQRGVKKGGVKVGWQERAAQ